MYFKHTAFMHAKHFLMKAVIKLYQHTLMAAPNNFTFWQICG